MAQLHAQMTIVSASAARVYGQTNGWPYLSLHVFIRNKGDHVKESIANSVHRAAPSNNSRKAPWRQGRWPARTVGCWTVGGIFDDLRSWNHHSKIQVNSIQDFAPYITRAERNCCVNDLAPVIGIPRAYQPATTALLENLNQNWSWWTCETLQSPIRKEWSTSSLFDIDIDMI